MGILDDLSSAFSKAQAGASRFADSASLKFKMGEAERKRRDYMAQLGESLYAEVCMNPQMKAGRETILAGIAQCDADLAQVQSELDRIARETAEAKASALTCPVCGGTLVPGARFCSTCGAQIQVSAPQPEAAPQQAAYTQATPPQQPAQPQQPGPAKQAAPAQPQQPAASEQSYEVPEK